MEILEKASDISVTLDIWANCQMKAFIGIIAHFICQWKLLTLTVCVNKNFTFRFRKK